MCKKLVWLATVVLLGLSCGQEPGSFTMSFSWKKAPDGQVWVWVRVEERADGTQSGPILASAGPETYIYGDSVTVAMNDVANGKNRYIIAEVRDGANPNLPIMYYGISEPFDLAPGMHNHIKIPMELQIPEAQSVTASISLEFDGKLMDQVGLNEIHVATIMTRSVRAKSIVLANDASFSVNQTQVDLVTGGKMECGTEEKGDMTWDVCS